MDGRQGVRVLRTVLHREALPVRYDDYPVLKSPEAHRLASAHPAGVWTLAHPVKAPQVTAVYREAAQETG